MRRRWRGLRERDDDGQVLLLVLAYAAVSISLVLVVVSASAVHLERKRLLEVADGAALDAADEVDESIYFSGGAEPGSVPLSDRSVVDAVEGYLSERGAYADFDDLTIDGGTGSSDGRTAEVTLYATVDPPLVGWALEAFSDGVLLRATSRARVDTG
jgi:hypothetical protein